MDFHFIRNWRLRRDERECAARAHQLALITQVTKALEVLVDGQARNAEEQGKALMALAASNTAQAEAFSTWIKSFQVSAAPTTSVVTEEDEWASEQASHLAELGLTAETVADLPPEFRLAFELQKSFADSVRSDTKA